MKDQPAERGIEAGKGVSGSSFIAHPLSFTRIWRLARKELREILRDRRTILTLVAMPLLLYPLLSVVFQQFSLYRALSAGAAEDRLGFGTQGEADVFERRLVRGEQELKARGRGTPAKQERPAPKLMELIAS